jgi:AraC-like DNA-binding protein
MKRNAIESNIFKLNTFRDSMDREIERIDTYVMELNHNEKLSRVAQLPNTPANTPDMFWFEDFLNYFNRFAFYSTLDLSQCFLFLTRNDVVYGSHYLNFSRKEFYEDYFQFGGMAFGEWEELFFGKRYFAAFLPTKAVTIGKQTGRYIPYLYSLPVISGANENETSRIRGTALYLLNVDDISELITNSVGGIGGDTYILERGNYILVSTDNRQGETLDIGISMSGPSGVHTVKLDGKQTLAIYVRSPYNGLSYLTLLPLNIIHSEMYQFRNIMVIFFAAAFLLGLSVSVFLSYRNTLPIFRLLSANSSLQDQLDNQRLSIKILYVDKLLKNDFASVRDMELSLKHIGLEFGNNRYRVILVRILHNVDVLSNTILHDQDFYKAIIAGLLRPCDIVHTLSHNELAVVAAFDHEDEIDAFISNIQNEFAGRFGFIPFFSVGEAYDAPVKIHYSLREAQITAEYAVTTESSKHVIWYRDITINNAPDLFTKEHEQNLIHLMRQGNPGALGAYLDDCHESPVYRTMHTGMKWLYLSHLHIILLRLSANSRAGMDSREVDAQFKGERKDYFEALRSAYLQLCSHVGKTKKSHNQKLREGILGYIDGNYQDSQLNVSMLASRFNLAESYFSQFFKEQTGETFSRYLEKLRINHACKLLDEGIMSVDDIARNSGYNNANTFRRAFKKATGTIPSEYVTI